MRDVQKQTGKFTGKAAVSVLLTLAAALALWLFIAANYRRAATAEISRSLITINSYKTAQIKAWLEDRGREALRLSRHPILGGVVAEELSKPGSRRSLLDAWLKNDSAQKRYASMAFLSPKGAVIAATPGYTARTENYLKEFFTAALLKGTPLLTDLYLAADGRPRLTMISPIYAGAAPGGKPLCLLVINIDPETEFYPLVKAAPLLFATAETVLVRREGGNVLFLTDLHYSRDSALKLTHPLSDTRLPAAKALKEGYSGFYEGVDYRGARVFTALNRTEGTDWTVITKVDRDAILAPVRTRERLALALILLAAGLVYLAVYSMLRRGRSAAAATLEESRHLLAETEKIGKVGGWEYKIDANELLCTEEVHRIHELDPAYKFDLSKDTGFYTAASRPLIERAMRRAIESGEGFDLELEIITAKGNNRAVHVIARPDLPNRRVYGFFQDITERKLLDRKLLESEARYRALVDASGDGILTADLETMKFRFANRTICRMLGYTAGELTGLSVMDIHPKEALPAVIAEFEAQARGEKILAPDLPCLRKDGSIFYADIATTPVTVDGRRCNMGIFRDITERKLAEQEQERLNRDLVAKRREMENFLYITSHDLRSPLVNIQGFAQNIGRYVGELREELAPAPLPQPVNEAVSKLTVKYIPGALKFILESSHKMDSLISSLLKVARLGRVEMKPQVLEMNDLVKKIVDAARYQLDEAGAAAKAGVLPPCKADPAAVSQIFANLLENAIKYRAEDRALSVSITGEARDARVLYKVADNGSGIAARDLGRIWDIFYRGAGAGEGEGIGLTVVKYMAEKNGGSIKAESEEGRGTVFYLELPAAGGTK